MAGKCGSVKLESSLLIEIEGNYNESINFMISGGSPLLKPSNLTINKVEKDKRSVLFSITPLIHFKKTITSRQTHKRKRKVNPFFFLFSLPIIRLDFFLLRYTLYKPFYYINYSRKTFRHNSMYIVLFIYKKNRNINCLIVYNMKVCYYNVVSR